jgi:hypothetical protein
MIEVLIEEVKWYAVTAFISGFIGLLIGAASGDSERSNMDEWRRRQELNDRLKALEEKRGDEVKDG